MPKYRTLRTANLHDRLPELFQLNELRGTESRPFDEYMFETFGAEIEYVRTVNATNPERIATIIEGDSGAWWVCRDFHYVNRVGYLVAKPGVTLPLFKDFRY